MLLIVFNVLHQHHSQPFRELHSSQAARTKKWWRYWAKVENLRALSMLATKPFTVDNVFYIRCRASISVPRSSHTTYTSAASVVGSGYLRAQFHGVGVAVESSRCAFLKASSALSVPMKHHTKYHNSFHTSPFRHADRADLHKSMSPWYSTR